VRSEPTAIGGVVPKKGAGAARAREIAAEAVALLEAEEHRDGLSASSIARRLGRRKQAVLEVMRADPRFEQSGRGPLSRWSLVPIPMPGSADIGLEISEAVDIGPGVWEAPAVAEPVEAAEPVEPVGSVERVEPGRRVRPARPIVARRINEAREVDEAARTLGLPVTVAPNMDRLRPWSRRRR
jgi:hypothetical protein